MQPEDSRSALERAEHDHDASILPQVRRCLRAAAGVVEVGCLQRAENTERIAALRGEIHVPFRRQRSRTDEEHRADPACDQSIRRGQNLKRESNVFVEFHDMVSPERKIPSFSWLKDGRLMIWFFSIIVSQAVGTLLLRPFVEQCGWELIREPIAATTRSSDERSRAFPRCLGSVRRSPGNDGREGPFHARAEDSRSALERAEHDRCVFSRRCAAVRAAAGVVEVGCLQRAENSPPLGRDSVPFRDNPNRRRTPSKIHSARSGEMSSWSLHDLSELGCCA